MLCRNMGSSPPSVSYVSEPSLVRPQRPGIVIVTDLPAYITDLMHALWYSVLFPDHALNDAASLHILSGTGFIRTARNRRGESNSP